MRDIKFRGISKETGRFVYGDLIQTKPNKFDGSFKCWIKERSILGLGVLSTPTSNFVEVEPETVGQFVEREDKNKVEIYEGDILEYIDLYECHSDAVNYFDVEPHLNFPVSEVYLHLKTGVVKYEDGAFKVNNILIKRLEDLATIKINDCLQFDRFGCSTKEFLENCHENDFPSPIRRRYIPEVIGNIHENPELLNKGDI